MHECSSVSDEEWQNHFRTLLNQTIHIEDLHKYSVNEFLDDHDSTCRMCSDNVPNMLNDRISEQEVIDCINDLPVWKAAGNNGLINEMFKSSCNIVGTYIA